MLKQHGHILDLGAVPSRSTINTSQLPEVDSGQRVGRTRCVYDGPEIGSTSVRSEVELTG